MKSGVLLYVSGGGDRKRGNGVVAVPGRNLSFQLEGGGESDF